MHTGEITIDNITKIEGSAGLKVIIENEQVKDLNLNRVIVASCTPLTHQPLFQDSIRAAGLNPYLFEMANIRNQCSWVHSNEWDVATEKAKDLVRMAVARAGLLEPQRTFEVRLSIRLWWWGVAWPG